MGADLACTSRDRDKRLEQVKLRITRRVFGLHCIFTAKSGADLLLVCWVECLRELRFQGCTRCCEANAKLMVGYWNVKSHDNSLYGGGTLMAFALGVPARTPWPLVCRNVARCVYPRGLLPSRPRSPPCGTASIVRRRRTKLILDSLSRSAALMSTLFRHIFRC